MKPLDIQTVRRIVPELLEVLQSRVRVLQRVLLLQPIGRRALAQEMHVTERILRAELDFLRQQGLLTTSVAGVSLSDEGIRLLNELEGAVASVEGRDELGKAVSRHLGIPEVIVVAGDCDHDDWVRDNMGYRAALCLQGLLHENDVLAVTGGSTVAAIANRMPTVKIPLGIKVVPARGGVGETVEMQANTVASRLAQRLGGASVMLHVPDRLTEQTLEQLLSDEFVQERLQEIRQATVVVHGIGEALQMAQRRNATEEEREILRREQAVAEAFGYYFREDGEVAYAMTTVGLRLSDLPKMRTVIAVAGGSEKARAVSAAAKAYRIDILVTDEGTASSLICTQSTPG